MLTFSFLIQDLDIILVEMSKDFIVNIGNVHFGRD